MKKKSLIWLLGGTATGKTTQSIELHKRLNGFKNDSFKFKAKDYVRKIKAGEVKTALTVYNKTIHLGRISFADCCGTDTLGKKEQIIKAYEIALKMDRKYIIVDGIMATGKWIEFLDNSNVNIFLFLLHFGSVAENVKRLIERRKDPISGDEAMLSEHTIFKVVDRRKYFNNLFNKLVEGDRVYSSNMIEANLSKETITELMLNRIKDVDR